MVSGDDSTLNAETDSRIRTSDSGDEPANPIVGNSATVTESFRTVEDVEDRPVEVPVIVDRGIGIDPEKAGTNLFGETGSKGHRLLRRPMGEGN
jgi:hypothetical protein